MTTARLAAAGDAAADFLPHMAPFLLLDRIVAIDGPTGRFVKHVTADDPLLSPEGELSPTLLVEAMAQGAGIVLGRQEPELRARGAVLAAIDHCDVTGSVAATAREATTFPHWSERESSREPGRITRPSGLQSLR